MGRVFSWEEFVRKEVPAIKDFSSACEEIRYELSNTDGVLGAVIFGSAIGARFMERSNIDCLVVYDEARFGILGLLHRLQASIRKRHIPFECIPVGDVSARMGLHTIGPSFASHLERAIKAHGFIKNNPLTFLRLPDSANSKSARIEEVLGYLRRKIFRFEQGIVELSVMAESEYLHFLRKILESPVHIARKVLWLLAPAPDDSKAYVIQQYPALVPARLSGIFKTLLGMDADYSREVSAQVHDPHVGRYLVELETITQQTFLALDFARGNALFILDKFQ